MILKYRTSPLSSPPHTSWSYIDNITHFSPSYNPLTSTLTVNLTLRYPPVYPSPYSPQYPSPSSFVLVLNDLAYLLTDEGKFLDKVFDPNLSSGNSTNPSNPSTRTQNSFYPNKKFNRPYNKPHYKRSYYKNQPYQSNQSASDIEDEDIDDIGDSNSDTIPDTPDTIEDI